MDISVGMPPGPRSIEYAQLAESLGYRRIWFYDSAALYEDVYVHLGAVAAATETIGIGTAVLVPNLRHVMTTASAIATVERLAPGRTAWGFGTGATARWVLNKPALPWATMERYLAQLRGLLAGEVVEIDGEACQMIHYPGWADPRPIEVPIVLSAFGPKGQGVARELADGVMTMGGTVDGLDWNIQMMNGTVLDPGEDPQSPRVKQAVGPWYVMSYHGAYQLAPDFVGGLPGGEAWKASIEAARQDGERHLAVHEGHVTNVTDRDQPLLDATDLTYGGMTWVGDASQIAAQRDESAAAGATELLYTPAGPDITRELQAFAAALG